MIDKLLEIDQQRTPKVHTNTILIATRDRLLINEYVLHYASVDSPFLSYIPPLPFKRGMGEQSAAYMWANLYTSVKQYSKVVLRDQLINNCCIMLVKISPPPLSSLLSLLRIGWESTVLHICRTYLSFKSQSQRPSFN